MTVTRKLVRREPGYEVWSETSLFEFDVFEMTGPADLEKKPEGPYDGDDPDLVALQDGSGRLVTVEVCYTPEGDYIGNLETAKVLVEKKGIAPERVDGKNVCSIGWCAREGKWYGWSHRAIFGFAPGDVVKEGDCCASSGWTDEYLAEHPEDDRRLRVGFRAETTDDAKTMAVAFAESVG